MLKKLKYEFRMPTMGKYSFNINTIYGVRTWKFLGLTAALRYSLKKWSLICYHNFILRNYDNNKLYDILFQF